MRPYKRVITCGIKTTSWLCPVESYPEDALEGGDHFGDKPPAKHPPILGQKAFWPDSQLSGVLPLQIEPRVEPRILKKTVMRIGH